MLVATKANRVIRIDDLKTDEYVKMGYTVATEEGAIVAEPITLESIKKENVELKKENCELKLAIENLEKELAQKVIGKKTPKAATE